MKNREGNNVCNVYKSEGSFRQIKDKKSISIRKKNRRRISGES